MHTSDSFAAARALSSVVGAAVQACCIRAPPKRGCGRQQASTRQSCGCAVWTTALFRLASTHACSTHVDLLGALLALLRPAASQLRQGMWVGMHKWTAQLCMTVLSVQTQTGFGIRAMHKTAETTAGHGTIPMLRRESS